MKKEEEGKQFQRYDDDCTQPHFIHECGDMTAEKECHEISRGHTSMVKSISGHNQI